MSIFDTLGKISGEFSPIAGLSGIFPLLSLITGVGKSNVNIPNLADFGIDAKSINDLFDLKRSTGRAALFAQSGNAQRQAASNLPSSLRQSTVGASIGADINSKLTDTLARFDAQIAEQQQNALLGAFQSQLGATGLNLKQTGLNKQTNLGSLDALSLLALLLGLKNGQK